jgi:hypothetical protein
MILYFLLKGSFKLLHKILFKGFKGFHKTPLTPLTLSTL